MPSYNVAGTLAGVGTVTGALAYGAPLAGAVTGTGAVTGVLEYGAPLAATVAGTGAVTGTVTRGKNLRGQVRGRGRARLAGSISGSARRIIITETDGTPVFEVPNVEWGEVRWSLNGIDEFSFTIPVHDDLAGSLVGTGNWFREAQVWRGDQVLFWGPIVTVEVNGDQLVCTCRGALWHLTRRHVGSQDRQSHLTNGDFEDGLAAWNLAKSDTVGGIPTFAVPAGTEATIATTPVKTGTRSAKLTDSSSAVPTDYQEPFLWQEFEVTAGVIPLEVTLFGWCYIPNANWTEDNQRSTGLLLARLPQNYTGEGTSTPTGWYTETREVQWSTVDSKHPRDTWVRHEVTVTVPANTTETIHCRLTAPRGVAYWDRIVAATSDALVYRQTDQATIIANLVTHAQDTNYNKSDANIDWHCPPTGVLRDRFYYFADHPNIWQAIGDIVAAANGVDVRCYYTRTQRVLETGYPTVGYHRTDLLRVELDDQGGNVVGFTWSHSGQDAASVVFGLGEGDTDREEAVAVDDTLFGGLTLEEVFTVPAGTPAELLDEITDERLEVLSHPEVWSVRMPASDFLGRLLVGDTIPALVVWGGLTIYDDYRIVAAALDPAGEWVEVTFNRRTET